MNKEKLIHLGEMMSNWHFGVSDPIYAVASFAVIGMVHPDREMIKAARLEVDLLRLHCNLMTYTDTSELHWISSNLDNLIYKGELNE